MKKPKIVKMNRADMINATNKGEIFRVEFECRLWRLAGITPTYLRFVLDRPIPGYEWVGIRVRRDTMQVEAKF